MEVDTIRHRWEIYRNYDDLKEMYKAPSKESALVVCVGVYERERAQKLLVRQVFRKLKPAVVLPDWPARVLGSCNEWVRRDRVEQLQECINAITAVYCPAILDMLEAHPPPAHTTPRARVPPLTWSCPLPVDGCEHIP